jgi:polyhydroxyalkanoate depolymerase
MPASFMTLFPQVLNGLEVIKVPVEMSAHLTKLAARSSELGFGTVKNAHRFGDRVMKQVLPLTMPDQADALQQLLMIGQKASEDFFSLVEKNVTGFLNDMQQKRLAELEFLKLFLEEIPPQTWTIDYDDSNVLLDLPSLRLIDISADTKHNIQNYTVVFAPRAGHHSNIAERVALFMRDQGLTRMAIVEQKCAEDIPLYVEGKRHYEGFDGQVDQYRMVLECLKEKAGHPSHLVAICQPGPLLLSTLILYPHLGKSFGSAGAPMHTEGEKGFLTDFARLVGEAYIDKLIDILGYRIAEDSSGSGRQSYDGRLQIFGFYLLGMDLHLKNFRSLYTDLKKGNEERVERQKVFYQWYHHVHHSPAGFIKDTYKKIFIRNELIRGNLEIGGKTIGIKDYPKTVPLWALGGKRDDITPPLHATGHMALIDSVPEKDKLNLLCNGGHMGLFRSSKILKEFYTKIVRFLLARSDLVRK